MASTEKLRKRIAELIERSHNVDFEDIKWVMDRLGAVSRTTKHTVMYRLEGCKEPLMLNKHNNGKKHLPAYCVEEFRRRMTELGHFGQDEDHEND